MNLELTDILSNVYYIFAVYYFNRTQKYDVQICHYFSDSVKL